MARKRQMSSREMDFFTSVSWWEWLYAITRWQHSRHTSRLWSCVLSVPLHVNGCIFARVCVFIIMCIFISLCVTFSVSACLYAHNCLHVFASIDVNLSLYRLYVCVDLCLCCSLSRSVLFLPTWIFAFVSSVLYLAPTVWMCLFVCVSMRRSLWIDVCVPLFFLFIQFYSSILLLFLCYLFFSLFGDLQQFLLINRSARSIDT